MVVPVHFTAQSIDYITKTLRELHMVGECVKEPCILTYYYLSTFSQRPVSPCHSLVIDWRNRSCIYTVVRIEETQIIPIKYWRIGYIGFYALTRSLFPSIPIQQSRITYLVSVFRHFFCKKQKQSLMNTSRMKLIQPKRR